MPNAVEHKAAEGLALLGPKCLASKDERSRPVPLRDVTNLPTRRPSKKVIRGSASNKKVKAKCKLSLDVLVEAAQHVEQPNVGVSARSLAHGAAGPDAPSQRSPEHTVTETDSDSDPAEVVSATPNQNKRNRKTKATPTRKRRKTEDDGELYECEECAVKFKRKGDLMRHVKRVHKKIQDAQCPVCWEWFGEDYNMRRHMTRVHKDHELTRKLCPKPSP